MMHRIKKLVCGLLFVSESLITCSCAQSQTEKNEKVMDSTSLSDVEPAGADEALFIGDSEHKVKSVLKRSLSEEKNSTVKDTSYYSSELKKDVNEYYLLVSNKMLQSFFIADGKLRNSFSLMAKVPSKKIPSIVAKIKSEPSLEYIAKGVFKAKNSPSGEYVMFVMIRNIKADSTVVGVLTAPNANRSEEIISHMKEFVYTDTQKRKGLAVETTVVE